MALVVNNLQHPVVLTVGSLAAGETRNIDISGDYEGQLIATGALTVLDPALDPPAPSEPFADRPRRVFVSSTQPVDMLPSDLWYEPTGTGVFNVWEMT